MRMRNISFLAFVLMVSLAGWTARASAQASAAPQGPVRISLDEAIQMALAHNHTLQAARSTIDQSEALEITANLRPNPVLLGDAQFLPIFNANQFDSNYVDNDAQFDLGLSYLFERGKKRQHRLAAAKDATAVTRSTVTGKERYRAGDISEDDYLKIKLQLLQFQSDASQAQLQRVQALSDLRQLLGRESVPADYDVAGPFEYQPVAGNVEDLQAKALATRPDLRAAQQGITAANSQYDLAMANGKRDVTAQINYTHVAELSTASIFGQIQIPVFDRNQGEIARTRY